jgi:hypothetical protein
LALFVSGGIEGAEEADNFVGFEMEAFDVVVGTAALDGGPVDDRSAAGDWIAHVGLLKDLFEAGAGAAVSEELVGSEVGVAGAVDDVEEAQLYRIEDGHFEVEIPRGGGSGGNFDF